MTTVFGYSGARRRNSASIKRKRRIISSMFSCARLRRRMCFSDRVGARGQDDDAVRIPGIADRENFRSAG
jgi:hypothetical protein